MMIITLITNKVSPFITKGEGLHHPLSPVFPQARTLNFDRGRTGTGSRQVRPRAPHRLPKQLKVYRGHDVNLKSRPWTVQFLTPAEDLSRFEMS